MSKMDEEGLLCIMGPGLGTNEIDQFILKFLQKIEGKDDEDFSSVPEPAMAFASVATVSQGEEKRYCVRPFWIRR
jgi:hypothetical protein